MECLHPLLAINAGKGPEGKFIISFVKKVEHNFNNLVEKYGKDSILKIPCGHCINCRKNHSRDFAIRAVCESMYHKENCFLTLTYDDDHLPHSVNDMKDDFNYFIKDLRNLGYKIRYYGCGEFGETSNRPHLHIVIFGYYPEDAIPDRFGRYFKSDFLSKIWSKGFVSVGNVEFGSCFYTAGYTNRSEKKTAFIKMSLRPGLGYQFALDNKEDILKGIIYGPFGSVSSSSPPRYFYRVLESLGLDTSNAKDFNISKMKNIYVDSLKHLSVENGERLLQIKAHNIRNVKKGGLHY